MHRNKSLFHNITTQLLQLRGSLRLWLSVEKDKSNTYGTVNVSPPPKWVETNAPITNEPKTEKLSQSSWEPITVVTSLDWSFSSRPWVCLPDWRPSQAEQLTLAQKSAIMMLPHVLSPLYEWRGDWTWCDGTGSQPRMQNLPFLLFLLPPPPFLFGHALRIALRIPAFSDSFLVFGLAVRQGNWRAFSKSRWVWGRSLIFSSIFPSHKLKQSETPLERAHKCSQGFQIKVPTRPPTRWSFSREEYPGGLAAFKKFEKWHTGSISDVKTTLCSLLATVWCVIVQSWVWNTWY